MWFFDAHCDVAMRAFEGPFDFVGGDRRAHVDLPRLVAAGHRSQVFAVFAPAGYYPEKDMRAHALQAIATIRDWIARAGGGLRLVLSRRDLAAAFEGDVRRAGDSPEARLPEAPAPIAAIIGLEGADALAGRAENLAEFFAQGVRLVIPAWDDNAFSGSSGGSGRGLSREGFQLVAACQDLGVVVDVSHLSDAAFEQVCAIARRPFVASHSNCRSICPSHRNLTDEQIRALAERGGALGLNLAPDFLSPDYLVRWDAIMADATRAAAAGSASAARQKIREAAGPLIRAIPLPGLEWVARHARHAIAVGGEDCVGLGGDLDGVSRLPAGVAGVEDYPRIAEALLDAGLTPRQVEKVCWRNMARVFAECLPPPEPSEL